MKPISLVIAAASASLLAACGQEPVVRKIALTAQPIVPSGSAEPAGNQIRVRLENVEPLAADRRLMAWAVGSTDAQLAALGPMVPGTPASFDPPPWIRGIEITEEVDEPALPLKRSGVTLLRGAAPGRLAFALDASDFAAAQGSAAIEDDELDVTAVGLPPLPTGYEYTVWLRFAATGETHAHLRVQAGEHGGSEPVTNEGMMRLGALPAAGSAHFATHDDLFEALECRITIESLQGVPGPSPCTTLRGVVELPTSGGAGDGHLH
jgi:hypothetical protein